MLHIPIKHFYVEFHRGNTIFKPIALAKRIFLRGPILNLGVIMNRP